MSATRDAIETLFEDCAAKLPPEAFAEVLDKLVWCLSDNGGTIRQLQRDWLLGNCVNRAKVALKFTEGNAFADNEEMHAALDQVARKWPPLAKECDVYKRRYTRTRDL